MSRRKIKRSNSKPVYPAATLVFYGPTDKVATKAVVSILQDKYSEPDHFRKWYTNGTELRSDEKIGMEIAQYIQEHGVKQTISPDKIFGCPHEEGID